VAEAAAAAEVTYCLRHVTTLLWDEDVKGAFSVTFYPENQETTLAVKETTRYTSLNFF
jgi:hypothetical protein